MRDLLGNVIAEGSLVWWLSKNIPLKVTRIDKGGLIIGNQNTPPTLAKITLEITIPVQPMNDGSEPQFTDFLCTHNPDAEAVIEKMLAGKPTQ